MSVSTRRRSNSNLRDVYVAEPLFKAGSSPWCHMVDSVIFLWCLSTHMLLTAWPYIGLSFLLGTYPRHQRRKWRVDAKSVNALHRQRSDSCDYDCCRH
jgi:hypothetical protein